jgi:hypothetical protein
MTPQGVVDLKTTSIDKTKPFYSILNVQNLKMVCVDQHAHSLQKGLVKWIKIFNKNLHFVAQSTNAIKHMIIH